VEYNLTTSGCNGKKGVFLQQKRREPEFWFPPDIQELLLLKDILAHAADGADPILSDLLPGGAGSHAVIRIANSGIIDVATGANILIHVRSPSC
jgi:hypothetical protein